MQHRDIDDFDDDTPTNPDARRPRRAWTREYRPDPCRFDSLGPSDTVPARGTPAEIPAQDLQPPHALDARPLIVLAEDNGELRALLAAALELVGYRVLQAETGERLVAIVEALLQGGDAPPLRLIVTDVRMPALGGLEAARALRAAGATTPLIFMTAFGDAWTRARAAELGAVLLDKPLSIGTLRQAVEDALAR
jgi:two-component system cell cycle sensor histidine kinase/response regulator CckA